MVLDVERVLAEDAINGELALESDGSFVYTPDENFFGDDTFSYRASDGIAESEPASASPPPSIPASDTPPSSGTHAPSLQTLPAAQSRSQAVAAISGRDGG